MGQDGSWNATSQRRQEREGREREREKAENSGVDKHNVGLNK
jgi:hypothetical protein